MYILIVHFLHFNHHYKFNTNLFHVKDALFQLLPLRLYYITLFITFFLDFRLRVFHRHSIPIYLYLHLKETEQKQYVKSYLKIGNIENPRKDVANPNALIYDQFSMKPKIQ